MKSRVHDCIRSLLLYCFPPPITSMSCKQSAGEELKNKDRLTELPDEILLTIMSKSLTMKEAARNSVLSHRWRNLWSRLPFLNFEDSASMEKIYEYLVRDFCEGSHYNDEERSKFVEWVNHVINQHNGPSIDEFSVSYDLPNDYQFDIHKWLVFAFEKQAKSLVLDFKRISIVPKSYILSALELSPYITCSSSGMNLVSLKSLCLKHVDVSTKNLELLLHSCTCLEILRILDSRCLTSIRSVPGTSVMSLKSLEVMECDNLKSIEISAPKLESFDYWGTSTDSIKLHIRDAYSLSKMSVGQFTNYQNILDVFASLHSTCVSKLEHLQLKISSLHGGNFGHHFPVVLTNLKHLELDFNARCYQSILGWIPLIEACPVLQKLKLNFEHFSERREHYPSRKEIDKRDGKPLKCLKTLELVGCVGCILDVEFATHVFENAVMLEEVIVHVDRQLYCFHLSNYDPRKHAQKLRSIVPQGVNFIYKSSN